MPSSGRFLEQAASTSRRTMDLNYFGVEAAIRGVLPGMVARRQGKVVIIASAMAVCGEEIERDKKCFLCVCFVCFLSHRPAPPHSRAHSSSLLGFAGFSSYAPSKWAVRGLADCLRSELLGLPGLSVHVAYPPDTDTPGYAAESTTKPPECHAASRAAGDVLYSADAVAAGIMRGLRAGAYHLPSPDLGQNLMVAGSAGLSPRPLSLLLDILLAPFIAVAMRGFGWVVDRAARTGATAAAAARRSE